MTPDMYKFLGPDPYCAHVRLWWLCVAWRARKMGFPKFAVELEQILAE